MQRRKDNMYNFKLYSYEKEKCKKRWEKFHYFKTFDYLCTMRRRIIAFGSYYHDFMKTLSEKESKKIEYILSLLEREDRMPVKFIKHIREHGNLYELRMKYENNIYRVFFIFDGDCIVVLFHGFQKKTQKTPQSEIKKALKIRSEYYEYKKEHDR